MAGAKKSSTNSTVYNGIQVQSSVAGKAITKGWGTHRASANMVWYGAFKAIAQTQGSHGGKGGAPKTTTYTYTASLILGIEAGPIVGIRAVYRDQSIYTDGSTTALAQAGLSVALGAIGQTPWGYLTTNFPGQAIGYSGLAYVYASDYALGSGGALANHSFEVVTSIRVVGLDDANPKDIVTDFLGGVPFWVSGLIADLTDYGNYCLAAGLLLSPVIEDQRTASDFLQEILQATNSDAVMGDGQLKIVPYGDTAMTGNGVTWTPNLTPIYDLSETHFIPPSRGEDPVEVDLSRPADAYNYVQVEFLDRAANYNTNVQPGVDQGAVDQFGRLQNQSPYSLHSICDAAVASRVAQLIVQRTANLRATYRFKLPANFGLLQPMDLVTLTTGSLNRVLVRMTKADEVVGPEGVADSIDCEAEQMLVGTAHAAEYSRQVPGGFVPDQNVDPGPVTDSALICPPRQLTGGDLEVWVGAAGLNSTWGGAEVWTSVDGTAYARAGVVTAAARIGTAPGGVATGTDPDSTHTLSIDLSTSQGQLLPATQAEVDAAVTLFILDSELMAYRDAVLASAYVYALGYLRRGLYGTTPAAHSAGAKFVRLDDSILRIPYDSQQAGTTLHVKLLSFNQFGNALESLADVTAQSIVLTPGAPPVVDVVSTDTQNVAGRPSATVLSEIDALTLTVATAAAALAAANLALANALAAVQGVLGVTETTGMALIRQTLAHLNLRDLANGWTSLDGDRIVTPVANGKKAISLMGAMNADESAFIANVSTFYLDAATSFASYQIQLQANFDANLALINFNFSTASTSNTALAALTTTLTANVGTNTSSITILQAAQATDHSTFSAQITTLNSNFGTLSGTVTSNFSTLSTSDSAQSAAIIGTSATLGGITTLASLTSTSLATATGQLYGSIGLAVNVNGAITSMTLFGGGGATNLGAVIFEAAQFLIKSSTHPSITPFLYDATSGTLFLQNITVQTANIATANITTATIAGNAVVAPTSGEVFSGTALIIGTELTDLTVSATTTGARVQVNCYFEIGSTATTNLGAVVKIYCDGTLIGQGSVFCAGAFGGSGVGIPCTHTPAAGTHSYTATYTATTGSGAGKINHTNLILQEVKR